MKNKNTKRGSLALISVLVVTSILLILAAGMAEAHISTLYQYNDDFMGKSVYYGAESCLEEAIRRVELDTGFTGTTISGDENSSCTTVVSGGANDKDIAVTSLEGIYTQEFEGHISVTENGTANNALLTEWKKI